MRQALLAAAFLCLLAPGDAVPAENVQMVKGVVKDVTADGKRVSILVKVTDGYDGDILFHLSDDAEVSRGKQKARPEDLKVGQKVTVHTEGGFAKSKPRQGTAVKVVIEAKGK